MAFVNSLFPTGNLRLIHGFQKSISAQTTIVGNGNAEYRIQKMRNYITSWRYPARLLSAVDRAAIVSFFTDTAKYGLYSFKFRDPEHNQLNNLALAYTGAANKFYLSTTGTAQGHPIFHLGPDVVVRASGTPSAYTLTVDNRIPVITVAGATSGITITGTFYHAARFDQASINWSMEALDTNNGSFGDNLGDISLIEVFEY